MNKRWIWIGAVVLSAAALRVVAQDEQEKPAGGAGMNMPAWMQLTGEHASLKKLAGEWDVAWSFVTQPGMPPMEGTGEARSKMIFGGRFLEQDFKSAMMGEPFEGRMYLGFDTTAGEYVSTWIDSMSPYLWVGRGKEQEGAIHLRGKEPDMMTGKLKDTWSVIRWVNDDEYVVEMYSLGPDGKKLKSGQLAYKRRKA